MNPSECDPNDWALYYSGCYMVHRTLGLVTVSCDDNQFAACIPGGRYRLVEAGTLSCIWPGARSINLDDRAVYIGRMARRQARRSATAHHYRILWASGIGEELGIGISHQMMHLLHEPVQYPTFKEALAQMNGNMSGVAVSRDLILQQHPGGTLGVIFQGIGAGLLREQFGRYDFIPDVCDSPLARRVQFKLEKEGLLCQSA